MRADGLRGALAVVIAGGFGLAAGSATSEGTEVELEASDIVESAVREPMPDAPRADARARGDRQQWWEHAREVLFSDLQLSAEQSREVDAIIETQIAARKRSGELRSELKAAQQQGDAQRSAVLRAELRASRKQKKGPHGRIEEMRALLTEEQRPTFDMNRARLVAEGQQALEGRQKRGRKRPRAGAEAE